MIYIKLSRYPPCSPDLAPSYNFLFANLTKNEGTLERGANEISRCRKPSSLK